MSNRSRLAIGLAAALFAGRASAECVPIVNGGFNVNGIVAGKALAAGGTAPGSCLPDSGWGGGIARAFQTIGGGTPDTHVSRVLFAGESAGANLDKLYAAIHVENDPIFSANDIATLYFDAGQLGTFGPGDFALRIELGPLTPPSGTEGCEGDPNNVTYYTYNGSDWIPTGYPDPAIVVKTSHDYNSDALDPESGIWEVEIGLDPALLGLAIPTANGLNFGAKLYVTEEGFSNRALAFPPNLTSDSSPNSTSPNDGQVTPANMAKLDVESCGLDVRLVSIDGVDHNGASSKFTLYPNSISGQLPENQKSKFKAQLRFINPANPVDNTPVAVPNSGEVRFAGKPWNAGFTANIPFGSAGTEFTSLGQIRDVQISWPPNEAAYAPYRQILAAANKNPSGHICMVASLEGFTVNLNEADDVLQKNLYFTTASTITEGFLVKPFDDGSPRDYYLRMHWANVPSKLIGDASGKPESWQWSYRFPNAEKIGLQEMGDGWYRLNVGHEGVYVDVELNGGVMPTKVYNYQISPTAGGTVDGGKGDSPLDISVEPGATVTIVANGLITVNGDFPDTGPDGFAIPEMQKEEFLLRRNGAFAPQDNIGSLIGSFDGFKTSFVIGGTRSFVVPDNAKVLSLAINDIAGRYDDNSGKGFSLSVTFAPPLYLPTRLALPGNPGNGLPAMVEAGAFLPQFLVDVMEIDEKSRFARPVGYAAYAIYESHN